MTDAETRGVEATKPTSEAVWSDGPLPPNVVVGEGTIISGDLAFKRFYSRAAGALRVGTHCTMDGVHFAVGPHGRMRIGDFCFINSAILLCELEVTIGNYVVIGWNTTLADTDFHPMAPAERISDAIACSPLGKGKPRPRIEARPIVIEDNVWIGPGATILKGVRISTGAWIEPGSVVTRDVPEGIRVRGNPAEPIATP